MKKIICACGLLFVFIACSKNETIPPGCAISNNQYKVHIKPIIAANCSYAGCHNETRIAGNDFDFTTYDGLKEAAGSIKDRINRPVSDPLHMPQGLEFTDPCDLYKLNAWLIAGAPNN